ncbi:MAG: 8-amino-7-oxononanoate synthase [Deltaproteobacteria bacterium]|nr:8-amino-7-oxononanoate synthase [Deltaproteobacteria bacterium]
MKERWKNRLTQLEQAHLKRTLRVTGVGPKLYTSNGEKLIFCSNDYLGLANSAEIANEIIDELSNGVGAGASRLVSGNFPWHERLEESFSQFVGRPASVLFPSGYQANVGAISALTSEDDIIFSDRLCHASIIDGCRLSKATVEIFDHNNMDHLNRLLAQHNACKGGKLIVTEGIFSMDGDMPPLEDICVLAETHNAAIYLDEAHSLGILGPEGRGLAASLGVQNKIDILVGTFGKAIGVSGACVACSFDAAGLLKSTARSLMYTTAPAPALSRAICKSLILISAANALRDSLYQNIELFKSLAATAGIRLIPSDSPIQPVLIGDAKKTMHISEELWKRGIFIQGIRPPTVASGTERLRITISAMHTPTQIQRLVSELVCCGGST